MKSLILLLILPLLYSCSSQKTNNNTRPNFLVLMSDNHYFENLGWAVCNRT